MLPHDVHALVHSLLTPPDGILGVDLRITVDWFEPLSVWVDLFVVDEEPRDFFRSR